MNVFLFKELCCLRSRLNNPFRRIIMFALSDAVGSVLASDLTVAIASLTPPAFDPITLVNMAPADQQAALGIDLNSSFYQAEGNTFIQGNNQWIGLHPFECVEFAYGRAMELGFFANLQGLGSVIDGDAGTWDDDLFGTFYQDRLHLQAGAASSQARANSLVVWEGNLSLITTHPDGSWETFNTAPAGHVGFVEAVYEDGSYLVSEANVNGQPFHLTYVTAGSAQYNEAEFIYLDEVV
jgi:hypothetical protein